MAHGIIPLPAERKRPATSEPETENVKEEGSDGETDADAARIEALEVSRDLSLAIN